MKRSIARLAAAISRLFGRAPVIPATTKPRTLIIAYNLDAAREFARDNGLANEEWRYVSREEDLWGWSNVKIVKLAGWRNRKEERFLEALRALETRLRWEERE